MCTAVGYQNKGFYFGRTLDYEETYGEEIVITPRRFPLPFRHGVTMEQHYAVCGMAHVAEGYPLYYDAMNEKGLCMAGLNFVENAVFGEPIAGMDNVAVFEFIPWLLGQCACLEDARKIMKNLRLTDTPFSQTLPVAQLHWLIGDKSGCLVVESTKGGLQIYENPVGVLTNNPPFPQQLELLAHYMQCSPTAPENRFSPRLQFSPNSRGMGAMGLPGDLSSQSRFVRAAFTKENSVSGDTEEDSVLQFFHILESVHQTRGCCRLENGEMELTQYASCCSADKGIYYYRGYNSTRICAVEMNKADLDAEQLHRFPFLSPRDICFQN